MRADVSATTAGLLASLDPIEIDGPRPTLSLARLMVRLDDFLVASEDLIVAELERARSHRDASNRGSP